MAQQMLITGSSQSQCENETVSGENTQSRVKYKRFTNSFKLSVLKETESLSVREVGRKYNINEATIRGWKKNKDKLEGIGGMRLPGGGRKPISQEMEDSLYEWILSRRSRNLRVTVKSICDHALVLFNQLGNKAKFVASRGWFYRFSNRKNLL